MVPFESFSTEAPQSSSAFCSGCEGGTQCEILSSRVFSCASAQTVVAANRASPLAAATAMARVLAWWRDDMGLLLGPLVAAIEPQLGRAVKRIVGYKTNWQLYPPDVGSPTDQCWG